MILKLQYSVLPDLFDYYGSIFEYIVLLWKKFTLLQVQLNVVKRKDKLAETIFKLSCVKKFEKRFAELIFNLNEIHTRYALS